MTTKLYRPPVSAELEPRVDLIARLEGGLQRALTLISAPTGYGKSTLASMWLDASEVPGGWVSLDDEDDDPRMFLAYVTAAIRSAFPEVQLDVETYLDVSVLPALPVVARTLLNDLERIPRRMLLALDDLQVIKSQAVYDFLAELLRHPSPKLHLMLISRRDPPLPLPSLRAYRQITEVRTRDLRFTTADTASLLTKMLHREIDAATAMTWTQRTEGWVTALGLAAIALRQRDHDDLHPDDGLIDSHDLQEHLIAEVLDRLDPVFREWLLVVAWLDRFCPALCAAVRQTDSGAAHDDLTGEAFVQRVRDENLFVIALDGDNQWFRFHHLFRELLQDWGRQQFDDGDIAAFHRRAGAWFAGQDLPDEAIRYLVSAGDCAAAEQVVQQHRHDLMNVAQWPRLQRWLSQFPDDVLTSNVMLMNTITFMTIHGYGYQKLDTVRRRAEQLLSNLSPEASGYDAALGELSLITGYRAIANGNAETVTTSGERALQLLPEEALLLRAMTCGVIAAGMQMSDQFSDAYQSLQETIGESQWTRLIRARLMSYLGMICFMQGALTKTQAWAEQVAPISKEQRFLESLSYARQYLGVIHYLRNEVDAAEPYLRALVEDPEMASPTHLSMGALALALIHHSRGEDDQADAIVDRLTAYFQEMNMDSAVSLFRAFSVDLALRRNDLSTAQRKQIGVDFDCRPTLWFFYIPQLIPVKLFLAEGTSDALDAARSTLTAFEQRMAAVHRNMARIDVLALLALVCDAQGDTVSADANLTTALTFAQGSGVVRTFVDLGPPMADLLQRLRNQTDGLSAANAAFVDQILAAFSTSSSVDAAPVPSSEPAVQTSSVAPVLPEPLTPRELQVLQQLATHLTPAEIAARHVVSVATVRWQIKSIYRKLDVHSRKEAVRRSHELNLV